MQSVISLIQQNEDMMLASARELWLEHSDCGMLSAIACMRKCRNRELMHAHTTACGCSVCTLP
jgi:hypothetical protein